MAVRPVRPLLLSLVCAAALVMAPASARAAQPVPHPSISYHEWTTSAQFATGSASGVTQTGDALGFGTATGSFVYDDGGFGFPSRTYNTATWTSPVYVPGFPLTELVASWNADTPAGTWVQVEMQGRTSTGTTTKWYVMGRWASGDTDIHRTSLGGQGDTDGTIAIDTFLSRKGVSLTAYQLRVTLLRGVGVSAGPTVRSIGAVSSGLPADKKVAVSPLGGAEGIVLNVPRYSQDVHLGHYPEFDGGGEAWCSPTSTEMVVEYYGKYPADVTWVSPPVDPSVDYAARYTFDYHYDGAGNWPFNTAYSASYGLDAFVTQLRSLNEAEQFITAGIPLTVSVSFTKNELDGSGYSTNGHLMNIVGFTANGDVVANDPVSPDDPGVRRVYNRAQFENVWIPTSRSGGIAYVVHDAAHPLPANAPGQVANW
ncbi:MAG: C39 family peptidase [Actinomycetota bacterium]|nr:C39 family peptidase [Actinomycetota bacterium]